MQYTIRKLLISVAVAALVAAVIGAAIRDVRRTQVSRAVDHTRRILTDFIGASDGDWPSSWDDLTPYADEYQDRPWTPSLESCRGLISVDFTFAPTEYFTEHPHPLVSPPKLISVKSAKDHVGWEELEVANRHLIFELLAMHDNGPF